MATARSSSNAKSESKKAAKGSASKKKPEESKNAASSKRDAKETTETAAKGAAKAAPKERKGKPAASTEAKPDEPKPGESKPAKAQAPAEAAAKPPAVEESSKAPPAAEEHPKAAPAAKEPDQPSAPATAEGTAGAAEQAKPEYEPIGPNILDGFELPAVYGKAGVFGGPRDHSAKPDDKLGLPTGLHFQYERYRSLNPKSFYCSMRWDYRQEHKSTEEGKRWWANKKLLVANPSNGKAVVVRAVDYGPHESTGLAISVSPGAAEALGINPGDEVLVAFADPKAPTGAVA